MFNVGLNQIFVSFLPPSAAATLLDFTQWWHKLDRHVYSRQLLIIGSVITRFCACKAAGIWLDWFIRSKHTYGFNILWVNVVDANFFSSTVFIHIMYKITNCMRPINVKQLGYSLLLHNPLPHPSFSVITPNMLLTTAPSHYCGSELQSLDDKSLSHYCIWNEVDWTVYLVSSVPFLATKRHQHGYNYVCLSHSLRLYI